MLKDNAYQYNFINYTLKNDKDGTDNSSKLSEEVRKEYLKLVESGFLSISRLLESGLSINEIRAFLGNIPLTNWPSTTRRFLASLKKNEA